MNELRLVLANHPVLGKLSETALEQVLEACRREPFQAGDILLQQGDISDSAIVILEGAVEVVVQTTSGLTSLATIREQALLGEIGVFAGLRRTATIRAIEPGCLLRIARDQFNSIADGEPQILRYVIGRLGGQIRAFNNAVGVYTNALAALEREEFDGEMLENLNNPPAELANFAAAFKKMARQITLRRQHREEMASATAIQRAMLPQDSLGRVDLFAAMRPARDVGGDFYDAFFIDEDRLAITIGDVSGKGVPASLFMAVCQTTIRMALREEPDDIGRALERANSLLEAENTTSTFATFFRAIIELRTGKVSYTNCGHNPAILRRRDGKIDELSSDGIALGVLSPAGYTTSETVLHCGDRLLLFTDGITEAHDEKGALFEDDRLKSVFDKHHRLPAHALVQKILAEIETFAGEAPQHDDLTCLTLAYFGADCGPVRLTQALHE